MSLRQSLLLLVVAAAGLFWIARTAVVIERHEYQVAHALAERGLSKAQQNALITGVLRASRFAFGSRSRTGRAGPFHLDAGTAAAAGLEVDRTIRGPFGAGPLRLLKARATEDDRKRDERFDLERSLDVAVAELPYRRAAVVALLPAPWHEDETLVSVLTVWTLIRDRDAVETAAHDLGSILGPPAPDDPLPGRTARKAIIEHLRTSPGASAKILDELWRAWITAEIYRKMLPTLQARKAPSLAEYLNACKGVLIELTGAARWLLHLVLGGLIYLVTASFLAGRGVARRKRLAYAFAVVAGVALAVELADAIEATATLKPQRPLASAADLLVTCLVPIADRLRRRDGGED